MSDRTLLALTAAMRASSMSLFWIDAFCIPTIQPQRSNTLESMGFIYHLAAEVIAVLSDGTSEVLEQMKRSDRLNEQHLLKLDRDEWVRSVWTYQEVVNSQCLRFVSSNQASNTVIDGSSFLNNVGDSLSQHKQVCQLSALDIRRDLPGMDALEDLIADWMTAGFAKRSALQIMSNLDRRYWAKLENYFYSMIGSITQDPSERAPGMTIADLSDTVMNICEQKNDYSFIYSATARDQTRGRRWRPQLGSLRSILPWHSDGEGQMGYSDGTGFWLDDIMRLEISARLDICGKQKILDWLKDRDQHRDAEQCPDAVIAGRAFETLKKMGFIGTDQYLLTANGIFYPQSPLQGWQSVEVFVATKLSWVFGAPALAKTTVGRDVAFSAGVFLGVVINENSYRVLLESSS